VTDEYSNNQGNLYVDNRGPGNGKVKDDFKDVQLGEWKNYTTIERIGKSR
jgi:hypothetical protein